MARIQCPSLIGRTEESARLDATIAAGRQGRGGVVFLIGSPGIGKTRLVTLAAKKAEQIGASVLLGRCAPSEVPAPYRPLTEALMTGSLSPSLAESPRLVGFRAALGRLVPIWNTNTTGSADDSPIIVAEALLRTLCEVARDDTCVLVLEDLQWADPETLHAIEYLADHSPDRPVTCLVTLRDEPGTAAMAMATRLEARRCVDVIRLRPLAPREVSAMARECLAVGTLPAAVEALLREGAEGIPFFVEELLAGATSAGALVRERDQWAVADRLRPLIPHSFAEIVRERLAKLDADGRRIIGTAAMLGRRFDWQMAVRAVDCAPLAARAALDRAIALQLLVDDGRELSFRHALTREAVLQLLGAHERAELAARALAAIEGASPSGDDWRHQAADLAETSGQTAHAASLLLVAGRASLERGALDTATAALERAARLSTDRALRADVLESLAEARSAAGDLGGTQSAVAALLDTLDALRAPPTRRGQAHLLVARCAVLATRFEVASEELASARHVGILVGDARLSARVSAVSAQLAVGEGRLGEAEALALRAVEEARSTHQPEVVCEALEVAGRCARTRGLEEAAEIFAQLAQSADAAGLPLWRMRAMYQLGTIDLLSSGVLGRLERARAEALRLGAVATAASLDFEIGAGLEMMYRGDEALAALGRCAEIAHLLDLRLLEGFAHAFKAIVYAERGARRQMEEAIARALVLSAENTEVVGAVWGDVRAVASLVEEDRARARRELQTARDTFPANPAPAPRPSVALWALLVALEGGEPDPEAVARAMGFVYQSQGYLLYAQAVVHGRAGRRDEAARLAALGDQQLAKAPFYHSLVRRLAAEAAIGDGWGEPGQWLAEAGRFFEQSGQVRLASACRALLRRAGVRVARPTGAVKSLPSALRELGVTPREADVLELVGEGLSNVDIARRLILSERTVEHHVGWLKRKLAVDTRAQMVARAAGVLRGDQHA